MDTMKLVHLSDTHYGERRNRTQYNPAIYARGAVTKWLQQVIDSFNYGHNKKARKALKNTLTKLSKSTSDILEFVHTGDFTKEGDIDGIKSELRYLNDCRGKAVGCITIGNHDLWPGEFPLFAPHKTAVQAMVVNDILPLGGKFPIFAACNELSNDLIIEIFVFNSAISDSSMNFLASGKLCPNCIKGRIENQLSRLDRLIANNPDSNNYSHVVRVAIIHHPVHDFLKKTNKRRIYQTIGAMVLLEKNLYRELSNRDFKLILCGHEHTLHPASPPNISNDIKVLQLSVGSPTCINLKDKHFCVLTLKTRDENGITRYLDVRREKYIRGQNAFLNPNEQSILGATPSIDDFSLDLWSNPMVWS